VGDRRARIAELGATHEPLGERFRLALACITGLADGETLGRRQRCVGRLDGVHDLVCDQVLTVARAGIVGTVAEEQVRADREGAGPERARRGVCVGTGVDAHMAEASP
jgi:hypothetical protein